MQDETKIEEGTQTPTVTPESGVAVLPQGKAPAEVSHGRGNRGDRRGGGRGGGSHRNERTRRPRERVKPEFDHKVISVRRVARVVAGGRRFSFSVALVAGNKKGSVGVGTGKGTDTALAIEKAMRNAKKYMITVRLTKEARLPHEVGGKYAASQVIIFPTKARGLVAGGSVRTVLELAGVKNASSKLLSRSKNHLNNAQAAIKALLRVAV